MRRLLLPALLAACVVTPSQAFDGHFIRNNCLSGDAAAEALCVGYSNGLAQALIFASETGTLPDAICVDPATFDPKNAAPTVLVFMDEHPGNDDVDGATLMMKALASAYPCE